MASRFPDLGPRWTIVEELGRGGTSIVFRAFDHERGHDVAVKVVTGRIAEDPEQAARLEREARSVASLAHPNIVGIYALEHAAGGFALVMQLVAGRTLRTIVTEQGPLPVALALGITRDVGRALAVAHDHGIIHRDVKPGNIFVEDRGGRALLADFGIARALDADVRITQTGVAIGTPAYMAPEQVDGTSVDGRSDVYSLALVLWEMLAGHHPWPRATLYEVIYRQKHVAPPPIRNVRGDVPAALEETIAVALHKDPADRWPSAREFVAAAEAAWGALGPQLRAPSPTSAAAWRRSGSEEAPTIRFRPADLVPDALPPAPLPVPLAAGAPPARVADLTPVPAADDEIVPWPPETMVEERAGWRRWAAGAAAAALFLAAVFASTRSVTPDDRASEVPRQAAASRRAADGPGDRPGDQPRAGAISSVGGALAAADSAFPSDSLPTALAPEIDRQPATDTAIVAPPPAPARDTTATPPPVQAEPVQTPAAVAPVVTPQASAVAPTTAGDSIAAPPAEAAPLPPTLTADLQTVVAGGEHSCAIGSGGVVTCWGSDADGQLGGGANVGRGGFTAVSSPPLTRLAAGIAHTCGLTARGEAYCWGSNGDGQLGLGLVSERGSPTRVAGERTFARIAAGRAHTCAATASGLLHCWGENALGQLGDGSTNGHSAPNAVRTRERAARVALGWNHSCLLTPGGEAYCWGNNADGQVGDGSRVVRLTPTRVAAPTRLVALSAGASHTCAVDEDGAAFCWGRNDHGQLGTGDREGATEPARARSQESFVEVAAGSVHTCARTRSRALYCWGRNTFGQLGDGTREDRAVPVRVVGLPPVVSVDARGAHTCAEAADGSVYCWGYNAAAQAGDSTRAHRLTPARVSRARGGGAM